MIEENCVMSQLYDWYSSPNIQVMKSKGISLAGHVAHRGGEREHMQNYDQSKPEGKRLIGRCKHI